MVLTSTELSVPPGCQQVVRIVDQLWTITLSKLGISTGFWALFLVYVQHCNEFVFFMNFIMSLAL